MVNSKHLFLLWILVILAVIALGSRHLLYLGLSNAANVYFSQGLILPTEETPKTLIAGLDLVGLIEKYELPVGSDLMRLSGLAKLAIAHIEEGQADLVNASNLGNPFADYELARWYTSRENWEQAAIYFDRAQPVNYDVINRTIDRLIESDRRSDAIRLADEYVHIHPNATGTYYRLANLHWGNGNRQETIQALANALAYDPEVDSVNYRYQTARLEYLQMNFTAAAVSIDDLLDENPSDFAVQFLAGQIYSAKEDYLKAEQHLIMALEQNPKHLHAHLTLAMTYLEQNKYLQAASEYQQASLLASDPSSYLNLLAATYNQAGEHCKENETLRILELANQGQVDLVTEFQNLVIKCSP